MSLSVMLNVAKSVDRARQHHWYLMPKFDCVLGFLDGCYAVRKLSNLITWNLLKMRQRINDISWFKKNILHSISWQRCQTFSKNLNDISHVEYHMRVVSENKINDSLIDLCVTTLWHSDNLTKTMVHVPNTRGVVICLEISSLILCYSDVIMSAMASQITGVSIFAQTFVATGGFLTKGQ